MMRRSPVLLIMQRLMLLSLLIVACGSPTDAHERELGILLVVDDSVRLKLPVGAAAGQPVNIELTTIGLSGCYRPAATQVEQTGNTVSVTPWDLEVGDACPDVLVDLEHDAVVTFEQPGPATVIVRGRDLRAGAGEVIEAEFRLDVH